MKTKLASIQRIIDIFPIQDDDKIECVKILGWQCVAKKGEFRAGDICVYFEVDSFLPVKPQFEFLRDGCFVQNDFMGEGFRLRTKKFRGQVSQGLALPLKTAGVSLTKEDGAEWIPGDDITDILGVRKWDMPEVVTGSGKAKGEMPFGIPKTDETRVQSAPELIEAFSGVPYYISTKMDGTSVTMYRRNGEFGVCGRNYEYVDDETCPFWRYAHRQGIREMLEQKQIDNIAIQGEFCGEGIQKNRLKLASPKWFIFTLIDLNSGKRLGLQAMKDFCASLGLEMVPIEETGADIPYKSVDACIERARGLYDSDEPKEGIVIRPIEPVFNEFLGGPLSMKVINNDFLLKQKE